MGRVSTESSRVVVTGGAGFIGSRLVYGLIAEGRQVVVVDDFSRGHREWLADLGSLVEIRVVDLRDYAPTRVAIAGSDCVYHLAARVGNVEFLHGSEEAELATLQANLVIDANVFRACVESDVRTLVYASSVSVYPIVQQQTPDAVFAESDISYANPDGGYGWAKLLGEIQVQWMCGPRVAIARLFNIYGEGEEPDENAHVVPALIRKAVLHPRVEFRVWGDGHQSRDLLHVEDLVAALIRLESVASIPPVAVNLGSGTAVDVRTLAEKIVHISKKPIEPIYEPGGLVGPRSRTADITHAKRLLNWEPKIDIDRGLRRTYAWVERRVTMS